MQRVSAPGSSTACNAVYPVPHEETPLCTKVSTPVSECRPALLLLPHAVLVPHEQHYKKQVSLPRCKYTCAQELWY